MTIAFVQSNINTGSSASIAVTQTSHPTTGDTIVVGIGWEAVATLDVNTVTDTLGNHYVRQGATVRNGTSAVISVWVCTNCTGGGANTVTATLGGTPGFISGVVAEYGPAAIDTAVTATATGTGNSVNSGNFTPTGAGETIVPFGMAGSGFSAVNLSYTAREDTDEVVLADRVGAPSGLQHFTATANACACCAPAPWAVQVVALMAASSNPTNDVLQFGAVA